MRRASVIAIALALVAAVAIGGCGSSSSSKSFADQANDICKKYDAKGKALAKPTSPADIGPYVDKAKGLFVAELRELHGLKPSQDKTALYNRWLGLAGGVVPVLDQLKTLGLRNDVKGIRRLDAQFQTVRSQAQDIARKLGFKNCAK